MTIQYAKEVKPKGIVERGFYERVLSSLHRIRAMDNGFSEHFYMKLS